MTEDGHTDDGVDEGDECEEGTNVEQRGQGHDQGEQQLADSLRRLERGTYMNVQTSTVSYIEISIIISLYCFLNLINGSKNSSVLWIGHI